METLESGNKKNDIHDHRGEEGESLREGGSRAIPQRQFSASFILMGYPPTHPLPSPPLPFQTPYPGHSMAEEVLGGQSQSESVISHD